jgi:hypothetical protein
MDCFPEGEWGYLYPQEEVMVRGQVEAEGSCTVLSFSAKLGVEKAIREEKRTCKDFFIKSPLN